MVRILSLLFLLLALPLVGEVKVRVSFDETQLGADVPIQAVLIVSHEEGQEIDLDSFTLDGKPLRVDYLGQSKQYSMRIINGRREENSDLNTRYQFTIPPQPEGAHLLPPISVVVDGKTYQSPPTTYAVESAETSDVLHLESSVEGIVPLYPGQRATLVYRVGFRESIELVQQYLPMLEAKGFRKLGEPVIKRGRRGREYVTEMSQEVEAVEPGRFLFEAAVVEGYRYETDWLGRKQLYKPRIRAESEPTLVEVRPFPSQGRPDTFSGAIGNFGMQVRMLTGSEVGVGDKVQVEVTISGPGEYHTVSAPNLSAIPEFRDQFRLSDIPPAGEDLSGSKRFLLELRPLSTDVTEIPPIKYAYFDWRQQEYRELASKPIPLSVIALDLPVPELPTPSSIQPTSTTSSSQPPPEVQGLPRIPIQGNYVVTAEDLEGCSLQSWQALWSIPVALLLVALQALVINLRAQTAVKDTRSSSRRLFDEAIDAIGDSDRFFALLEKALLTRLMEEGLVEGRVLSAGALPEKGVPGEVKQLLAEVEEKRYGLQGAVDQNRVLKEAKTLYNRIGQ